MNTCRLACVAVVGAVLVSTAAARDIFVNNQAGDDGRLGMRAQGLAGFDGPVRTMARALQLANGEDRIVLAATGVAYRESISLVGEKHSGSQALPMIIEGNGGTLEGAAPVPLELWEHDHAAVFRFRPLRLAHGYLFLNGRPLRFHPPGATRSPPRLEELEWTLTGGYIYLRIEPAHGIDDYRLSAPADGVGITLYQVHDVLIRNLTVQGFALDGISACDGVRDCTLDNVTCRGNGRSGVAVANASRLMILDSLLGDNLTAQVLTEGLSFTRVESSDLLPQTAPAVLRRGGVVWVDGEPFQGGE